MGRLDELEAFVKVVEVESFSEAGRQLGISKSYVSKQLSKLEDRLGARLLNRTTRQLTLTDVGAMFYERCVEVLEELEEAEVAVSQLQGTPRGVLRLSLPMSFGVKYLSPVVSDFIRQYNDLKVEIAFSDRTVNIVDEGFDLAVRIGRLKDSSLIARKLTETRVHLVASPSFLEEHGKPGHPSDLKDYPCLRYTYQTGGANWQFVSSETGEEVSVKVDGPMTVNNGDAILEATRHGVGCAVLPDFFINEHLTTGELVKVLDGWDCGDSAIWAIYPHNRHLSAKVRLFVDFLAESLSRTPW